MSKNRRILFFATKKDMINVFLQLNTELNFVKTGNHPKGSMLIYSSIEKIPDLNFYKYNSHCVDNYLVVNTNTKINVEEIQLRGGEIVKSVYQSFNMDSIVFSPGGVYYKNNCLIHSQIATMSNSTCSKYLFNALYKSIRKQFQCYSGWWIGKEAMELYGNYRFITMGVDEPELYDFKITND